MSKKFTQAPPQVYIDTSKIDYTCDHLENQVDYGFGYSDKPIEEMVPKDAAKWSMKNYVCFSGYSSYLPSPRNESDKGVNRVYYKLTMYSKSLKMLTDKERARWITLSRMHGLLPAYIKESSLDKAEGRDKESGDLLGHFFFDISDIPASLIYVYLSTIRNLREDPGFAKTVIYLVDELGMNYYSAFVFGSRIAMTTTGHHILSICRPYGERYTSKEAASESISTKIKASARLANCLRRYIHEPSKYDKNKANKKCSVGSSTIISSITSSEIRDEYSVTLQEFLNDNVVKAVMSLTTEDFLKYMKISQQNQLKAKEQGA